MVCMNCYCIAAFHIINPFQMLCRCHGTAYDQTGNCACAWEQPSTEGAKVLLMLIHFLSSALTRYSSKVLLNFFFSMTMTTPGNTANGEFFMNFNSFKDTVHHGGTSLTCQKAPAFMQASDCSPSYCCSYIEGRREESSSPAISKQNYSSCFIFPKLRES